MSAPGVFMPFILIILFTYRINRIIEIFACAFHFIKKCFVKCLRFMQGRCYVITNSNFFQISPLHNFIYSANYVMQWYGVI